MIVKPVLDRVAAVAGALALTLLPRLVFADNFNQTNLVSVFPVWQTRPIPEISLPNLNSPGGMLALLGSLCLGFGIRRSKTASAAAQR